MPQQQPTILCLAHADTQAPSEGIVARFLLAGDTSTAPVKTIIAESGVNPPPRPNGAAAARSACVLYTVACPSFVRQLAAPWERQAAAELDLIPLTLQSWLAADTDLLLRQEFITYIEKVGGVTTAGGAQRDGRVRVLWSILVCLSHYPATAETDYGDFWSLAA